MRITSTGVHPELRLGDGQPNVRPGWAAGQTVQATVLPGQGNNLVRLSVGGLELWASWPGTLPSTGELLELKVIGQQQGVWQMEVLTTANQPTLFLPQLLADLGLDFSFGNLQQLRRHLQGKVGGTLGNATEQTGICPLDQPAWQQIFGFIPSLTPLLLSTEPFPCGLLVGEREPESEQASAGGRPFCFVLAADFRRLGPVRVVGIGTWPRFDLQMLAGEDCLGWLQKTEREFRQVLGSVGLEAGELTYRAAADPILLLPTAEDLFVRGIDLKL